MTQKDIRLFRNKVTGLLEERRLREALALISSTSENAMLFELNDEAKRIGRTYEYMLTYFTEGADDPERQRLWNDLIAKSYVVLDNIVVRLEQKENPSLYYNLRRYRDLQRSSTSLDALLAQWSQTYDRALSMSSLIADAMQRDNGVLAELDKIEKDLFNAVWTSYPLGRDNASKIVSFITADKTPYVSAYRLTAALLLAGLEYADAAVIEALADVYTHFADGDNKSSRGTSILAMLAIVILLYKYRNRTFETSVKNRIEALNDSKRWRSDIRTAFMEFVRSRDTERVNRAMYDEIIPSMISMKPDIEKKLKDMNSDSLLNGFDADNPDWEEFLNNSEIGDKLKELNDLQMEGSDLYMGTFSSLKNFPFFNDLVNWFTPFDRGVLEIEKMIDEYPTVAGLYEFVEDLPYLCDNDRFSMLFSIKMVPGKSIDGIMSHLMSRSEEFKEATKAMEGITDADVRKTAIQNSVRNIYRLVHLFRRKGEFYNIFAHEINLLEVDLLRKCLEDTDLLRLIGEFYFRHSYYRESLTAFKALDRMGEFDAMLYQKMGYAYQQIKDTDNALRFYEQADLLDNGSKWLKLRLAGIYRIKGRVDDAVSILARLAEQYPDEGDIALQLGYAFVSDDNYREALKHFFKAEFIDPESHKVLRPIAWSLFMVKEFEKALEYYAKLLTDHPTPNDYLNMGHVSMAMGNFKEAINYYNFFLSANNNDISVLLEAFKNDRSHLERVGVKNDVVSLVADAILFRLDSINNK